MSDPRNLVLLLSSGHTVRITLRENDLRESLDGDPTMGAPELREFLGELSAALVLPYTGELLFAYVENPMLPQFREGSSDLMPDDHQRITVEGPGTVVQY